MTKVLMTTDTVGGVWTFTVELCKLLCSEGIQVELASMGRPLSPEQHRQLACIPDLQLHESEFRLCWMQDSWDDVSAAASWLLDLEDRLQPDVIHLNDLAHGNLPWQAPVLMVGHSCVYSWHQAVKGRSPGTEWLRYHSTVSASIAAVDLLTAPSRAMLDALLAAYGPVRRHRVIYNGRDFAPGDKCAAAKEPFVLAAGRLWDEAKNMAALTAIAKHLHWPLYLAGETSEPGRDGDTKATGSVHYLGLLSQGDLSNWMQRASIYAAPAFYEPFGLGILEAAHAGCALVLGDIPSLRELWEEAAIFVAPNDHGELCQRINELSRQDQLRELLAKRARERAQPFTARRTAEEYLAAYRHLIASQQGLISGAAT